MNFLDRHVAEQAEPLALAAQPFLKWAGGKRWLFKRYRHLFPLQIDRLVDPFVGGGSSFFYLQPSSALLGDLNGDLINLYQAVRDDPRSLTKRLIRYHHAHCKKFYYSVRAEKPVDPVRKAAWSLYLNRTCWNGLFRVNLKGHFNVPIGTKTKVFTSLNELDAASLLLKRTTFADLSVR
jgi:DNA adenine methylase